LRGVPLSCITSNSPFRSIKSRQLRTIRSPGKVSCAVVNPSVQPNKWLEMGRFNERPVLYIFEPAHIAGKTRRLLNENDLVSIADNTSRRHPFYPSETYSRRILKLVLRCNLSGEAPICRCSKDGGRKEACNQFMHFNVSLTTAAPCGLDLAPSGVPQVADGQYFHPG